MIEAYGGAKSLTSWPKNKREKEEGVGIHAPDDLKTSH
jgi:hypothetical protein